MTHTLRQTTATAAREGETFAERIASNAHHSADSVLQKDIHAAVEEMKTQPVAVRSAFYHAMLGSNTAADHLPPGFEIVNDRGRAQLKENGKVVYDERSASSKATVEMQIHRGEGPEAAFRREGYSAHDAFELGKRIKAATGKGAFDFKQGETYSLNEDGSVKLSLPDRAHPGNSIENLYKDGKLVSTQTEDNGKQTTISFQADGKTAKQKVEQSPDGRKVTTNYQDDGLTPKSIQTDDGNGNSVIDEFRDDNTKSCETKIAGGTKTITTFKADGITPENETERDQDGTVKTRRFNSSGQKVVSESTQRGDSTETKFFNHKGEAPKATNLIALDANTTVETPFAMFWNQGMKKTPVPGVHQYYMMADSANPGKFKFGTVDARTGEFTSIDAHEYTNNNGHYVWS